MRKQTKIATRWFLIVLAVMFGWVLGIGVLMISKPAPVIPKSNCPELLRMYSDKPPAHVVIKCKGLV
jgi:hypothetical protein